jgi:hypothetical protein
MVTPCFRRISERNPFLLMLPVNRSKESTGIPYIKTGLVTCLPAIVSAVTVSVSEDGFLELLHDTKKKENNIYIEILRRINITLPV